MQTSKRVPNKRLLSRIFAAFLISAVLPIQFLAQNFANPDLNGTVFSYSTIPASWQKVDATDPACLATNPNLSDTPDLCNLTEPGIANGVGGFAFSGRWSSKSLL